MGYNNAVRLLRLFGVVTSSIFLKQFDMLVWRNRQQHNRTPPVADAVRIVLAPRSKSIATNVAPVDFGYRKSHARGFVKNTTLENRTK